MMIKIGVVMGEVGKHRDKREKEGRILMLSFFGEVWERKLQRRVFCWRF